MNDINTKEVAMLRRRVDATRLDEAIAQASESLVALQHPDGHWVFELEADVTIPSEFILLQHYFGRIEPELQARIAKYIRATQGADGGWPLFHGGALDISASVKAYFALKAAGDPVDAPHMARARAAILAGGGARRCNVFTRILLALFGEVPWRAHLLRLASGNHADTNRREHVLQVVRALQLDVGKRKNLDIVAAGIKNWPREFWRERGAFFNRMFAAEPVKVAFDLFL